MRFCTFSESLIFDAILVPSCLHLSFKKIAQILLKIDPKMYQFVDRLLHRLLHRFFCDFGSIWGTKLRPCWRHFRQKGGGTVKSSCVRCCVVVFFRILGCLGRVWTLFSFDVRGFGLHFSSDAGSKCYILRPGGNARSVRNSYSNSL